MRKLLLLLILLAPSAWADVESSGDSGSINEASSRTVSATLPAATDTLCVGVSWETITGSTISGVTYDSTSLTAVSNSFSDAQGFSKAEFYCLDSPTTGSAEDIVVTFTNTSRNMLTWFALSDTGTKTGYNNEAISTTAVSNASITNSSGDMILSTANCGDTPFTYSWTNSTEVGDYSSNSTTGSGAHYTATGTTVTITATTNSACNRQALSTVKVAHSAPANTVTYNQANYDLDDLVEATATGFSSTLTTITEQAGGDTISAESGASSSSADFVTGDLDCYTSTGACNNTQWDVSLTWQITDGTDTADSTFTIDAPSGAGNYYYALSADAASLQPDSLFDDTNGVITNGASGDYGFCRTIAGPNPTIPNGQWVPAFGGTTTMECRLWDVSAGQWGDPVQKTYLQDSTCPEVLTNPLRSPLSSPLQEPKCVSLQ